MPDNNSRWTRFEICTFVLTVIGLGADLITIMLWLDMVRNTENPSNASPPETGNYFFITACAVIYSLAFLNALLARKWIERKQLTPQTITPQQNSQIANMRLCFSWVTTIPFASIYIWSLIPTITHNSLLKSDLIILVISVIVGFFLGIGITWLSYGFDRAINLFTGEETIMK